MISTTRPGADGQIHTREELIFLLNQACELEHGLACDYLYTAFSIKQDLSEGGLTWDQVEMVRKWAAQIYFVASQEMLHLSQANNLLIAIGGAPHLQRPNFPQPPTHYPLDVPLRLSKFGRGSLRRFIRFEHPEPRAGETTAPPADSDGVLLTPEQRDYHTVGELYDLIASGFRNIPEKELFIGRPEDQLTPEISQFPYLIPVTDRESALAGIQMILDEGEGTPRDRVDCHYGIFKAILAEYQDAVEKWGDDFQPVRPVVKDPRLPGWGEGGNPITHPFSQKVLELFDDVYEIMLLMLYRMFAFTSETEADRKLLSNIAIGMMPRVLKPLGDALCLLPDATGSAKRAGPDFRVFGTAVLLPHRRSAWTILRERMATASLQAARLAADPEASRQLQGAARNLAMLSQALSTGVLEMARPHA